MKGNKNEFFLHDMIHNNPGLAIYETKYTDPEFLAARGYDAKVFDLYDCAQYGLLWDGLKRGPVFSEGSAEREWVLRKRRQLLRDYDAAKAAGLRVCFMMDIIVLPTRLLELYPEVLNQNGKIDILSKRMTEILDCMFAEMFAQFPQIDGIYIRYGETYVGQAYNTPWHTGNNPIQGDEVCYHAFLMKYLVETVCNRYQREVYYRTWGFGKFQNDPATYLAISDQIPENERFYFCIKHTTGDFHRTVPFNQCLNIGRHRQIVEVQAAREYEGKGAYPNYIAGGVIHGFEEYKWLMDPSQNQCLSDVMNKEKSLIAGIWTWSRGGGWDGPYINGKNGKNGCVEVQAGSELWADINAYVIGAWAKDPLHSDRYYAIRYAKEVLGMCEKDANIFYEICTISNRAVLLGRACNTPAYRVSVFFTRDQNVDYPKLMETVDSAIAADGAQTLLYEQRRSVMLWEDMICLAEMLEDDCEAKKYILTTCRYGLYLFSLYEQMFKANVLARLGAAQNEINECIHIYEAIWKQWYALYHSAPGCPTLFAKENKIQELIGYNWNRGFDSAMDPLRTLSY